MLLPPLSAVRGGAVLEPEAESTGEQVGETALTREVAEPDDVFKTAGHLESDMHTRSISHPDGPSSELNVDEIWTTLVRETRHVCRESANAATDPGALSIYRGSAGFAVFSRLVSSFFDLGPPSDKVARANLHESLQQISQNCLPTIVQLLGPARWRPKSSAKISFLETPLGVAAEVLIDALGSPDSGLYRESDVSACASLLRQALAVQSRERDEEEDDGCEVLYGQAGLLYALLRLRDAFAEMPSSSRDPEIGELLQPFVNDETIGKVVTSIITRGRFGASVYASNVSSRSAAPSLMWSWHHKRYLGAAHGVAGILHVLLMCPVATIEQYIPDILQTIEWLTTRQDSEGNWPSSLKLSNTRPSELLQWCHGAPGILILFSTLIRRAHSYPDLFQLSAPLVNKVAEAVQKGAALVYKNGFLRKGVGLCHGVAGSIYALLAASDTMGMWKRYDHSKVYFLSAIHLAHLATSYDELTSRGEMTIPDQPWSLYGGVAGMCCAWAEVYDRLGTTGRNLEQLEYSWCRFRSGMPGFDDIILRDS